MKQLRRFEPLIGRRLLISAYDHLPAERHLVDCCFHGFIHFGVDFAILFQATFELLSSLSEIKSARSGSDLY